MNILENRTASDAFIAERLKAQTRVLKAIASECWNEDAARKIENFIRERDNAQTFEKPQERITRAEWPKPPTLW